MLRGFAALSVVIHHVFAVSNGSIGRFSPDWLTTVGAAGVDVFFVISGFIMYYTSFTGPRSSPSAVTFLKRRVLRIYPIYWICLGVIVLVYSAGFMKSHSMSLTQIIRSVLLWPGDPLLGVSWTLSYEMLFYLAFALSLLSASSFVRRAGAVFAIIAGVIVGSLLKWDFFGNPVAIEFCLGMVVAANCDRIKSSNWISILGLLATGALFVASMFIPHKSTSGLDGWSRLLFWGLPSALILIAFLRVPAPSNYVSRAAVFLGDASYSLYLTHIFVTIGYGWLLKKTGLGVVSQELPALLIIMLAVLVGVATYLAVERPLNTLVRRHIK